MATEKPNPQSQEQGGGSWWYQCVSCDKFESGFHQRVEQCPRCGKPVQSEPVGATAVFDRTRSRLRAALEKVGRFEFVDPLYTARLQSAKSPEEVVHTLRDYVKQHPEEASRSDSFLTALSLLPQFSHPVNSPSKHKRPGREADKRISDRRRITQENMKRRADWRDPAKKMELLKAQKKAETPVPIRKGYAGNSTLNWDDLIKDLSGKNPRRLQRVLSTLERETRDLTYSARKKETYLH